MRVEGRVQRGRWANAGAIAVAVWGLLGAGAAPCAADELASPAEAASPPPRRPMPAYDPRPPVGIDAADVLLWIPRVTFAPLYFATEYLVRRPLGWLLTELERADAFGWLHDFFTFYADRRAGILPTIFYDFGFRPSVGIYFYWNRFLFDENRIAVHAATWGRDWLTFTATDRIEPRPDLYVEARFAAVRRPDQVFGGIGWDATTFNRTRYAADSIDTSARFGIRPWRRSELDYSVGFRTASFESNAFDGDPGVATREELPPGFATGYSSARLAASFLLDTRAIQELSSGGVVARAYLEHHQAVSGVPVGTWLRWGGELTLATDVLGQGRVLAVRAETGFVTPLTDGTVVPFTELMDAGGRGPLPGFWWGQLRGFSLAVVTLEYVWPIWAFLDATLSVALGNTFEGDLLQDFDVERLRMSFAMGVLPRVEGDHLFSLLFGLGTETFALGFEIISARFAFGTRVTL